MALLGIVKRLVAQVCFEIAWADGLQVFFFFLCLRTSNPLLVELWAINTVVEVISKEAFLRAIIESDTIGAIDSIVSSCVPACPYLKLVRHIWGNIPPHSEVRFHLIARKANSATDCLARSAHTLHFSTHCGPVL